MSSIVGFNINKINVEKKKGSNGKISVQNNVSISDVAQSNLGISGKQKAVDFKYSFESKYNPDVASILIEGNLLYMTTEDDAKQILDKWSKDKKVEPKVMEVLLNHILIKCNTEALILARDVNLPAPFPLPKVKQQEAKK